MPNDQLGCVWEINQPITDALRAEEKRRWAGVALSGIPQLLRDWSTSASVALAERVSPLTHDEFISQTYPNNAPEGVMVWRCVTVSGALYFFFTPRAEPMRERMPGVRGKRWGGIWSRCPRWLATSRGVRPS